MATEEAEKTLKHGIEFPWRLNFSEAPVDYRHLELLITHCDEEQMAESDEPITAEFMNNLKSCFNKDKLISLFVHQNTAYLPVFCVLLGDNQEQSPNKKTFIEISKKFKSFSDEKTKYEFFEILYSKENTDRLKELGLYIQKIDT